MPKVKDVYTQITKSPSIIAETTNIKEIKGLFKKAAPIKRSLYVVDSKGELAGIITIEDLLKAISVQKNAHQNVSINKRSLYLYVSQETLAKDIMRSIVSVTLEDNLEDALNKMVQHDLDELPVIDGDRKVIGDLNAYEIITEI
ncbi:MAG: CBS domain-containing protein [Bacillus sp. (in: Bacteria)]|nr:CBS domain-containing protein [Bacillus sp. (in: firmicutes)]